MNAIFSAIFIASALILCIAGPNAFLPALLNGAKEAAITCLTLFCIYSLWMGLSHVASDAGINDAVARLLRPACYKFFRTRSALGAQYAAMNVTCNVLGLGGAATPFGVKAMKAFDGEGNIFGRNLLFIINATSVQIVPSTVIALRASYQSAAPADIFAPALLTTAICTGMAVILYFLSDKLCRSLSRRSS